MAIMQFPKIGRSSVTEQTIEYFKDQILSNKLKPGQQLPCEENLASQLGVGRGTVREALRVLVYLGFIERRNKATTVTAIAQSQSLPEDFLQRIARHRDVMKVIEVRKIVEPEAAALAAERADERQIAEMSRLLAEMERESGSTEGFAAKDQEFHLTLFEASGNHILLEFMKNIQRYMHENQVLIVHERPQIKPRSLSFHRRLFEAIRDGQDEQAREIMREHVEDIEREMYSIIKDSSGSPGRGRP